MVPEIEVREPICEAFQSGRIDTFGAVDDAQHPAEVEPGEVTVGGFAGGQVEGEVGRRRKRMRILGQRPYPSGRPFQERNRARQLGATAAQDGCADAQHQTHVVVEGQPRHDRGICCGLDVRLREKAAHQLLEIHLEVAVRDHDPGWQPGRTRAVLQIRRAGKISCRKPGPSPSASRFIESISTIFGAVVQRARSTYSPTSAATADVVRTTEGDVSAKTALTRS